MKKMTGNGEKDTKKDFSMMKTVLNLAQKTQNRKNTKFLKPMKIYFLMNEREVM